MQRQRQEGRQASPIWPCRNRLASCGHLRSLTHRDAQWLATLLRYIARKDSDAHAIAEKRQRCWNPVDAPRRGGQQLAARCSHRPRDSELRVVINGETCLTRRCLDAQEAFALAERWKRKLIAQGWRQLVLGQPRGSRTEGQLNRRRRQGRRRTSNEVERSARRHTGIVAGPSLTLAVRLPAKTRNDITGGDVWRTTSSPAQTGLIPTQTCAAGGCPWHRTRGRNDEPGRDRGRRRSPSPEGHGRGG